jgi:hypothetical protein
MVFFLSLCHYFQTGPGILFSCFSCRLIKCVCLEVERPQRETGNGIPPKAKFRDTGWFKYDWDDLCVNKSQFVPVIFEPPCTLNVIELVAWFGVFLLAGDILVFKIC